MKISSSLRYIRFFSQIDSRFAGFLAKLPLQFLRVAQGVFPDALSMAWKIADRAI
jgi:hypothetical protein